MVKQLQGLYSGLTELKRTVGAILVTVTMMQTKIQARHFLQLNQTLTRVLSHKTDWFSTVI